MTTVSEGAYIAALEKKLMEAESALYGFRAIFNNYRTGRQNEEGWIKPGNLYPGQLENPEDLQSATDECLE
jgi:hypothetical protein